MRQLSDSKMHITCLSKLPSLHRIIFPSVLPPLAPLGVVSLSQALCSSDDYSNTLLHLDLSKNPGVLSGEDATVRNTHLQTFIYSIYLKKKYSNPPAAW